MDWLRLSSGFADHPRIRTLSDSAFRLYIAGLCYAARYETDGRLPFDLSKARRPIAELLDAQLWAKNGTGYEIHDWAQWQKARDELAELRSSAAERQRRYRARRNREEW